MITEAALEKGKNRGRENTRQVPKYVMNEK